MTIDSTSGITARRDTFLPLVAESHVSSQERWRERLSTLVFLVTASVLFMSGLGKLAATAQLYLALSLSPQLGLHQFLLLFVVALGSWELILGCLCVARPRCRVTAALTATTIGIYALYLSVQTLRGVTSCPCLGEMGIRSMLVIDYTILLSLFVVWKKGGLVGWPNARSLRNVLSAVLAVVAIVLLGSTYAHGRSPIVATLVKATPLSDAQATESYRVFLHNNSEQKLSIHCIRRSCGRVLKVTKLQVAPRSASAVELRLPRKTHVFSKEDLRVWVEADSVTEHRIQIYR